MHSIGQVDCSDGFTELSLGYFQIRRNMVNMSVPQQNLHRFERMAVSDQAARERPPASVTAVP